MKDKNKFFNEKEKVRIFQRVVKKWEEENPQSKKITKRELKELEKDMKKYIKDLFKKMDKFFTKEWSKKCPEYYKGCIVCEMWKIYEEFKVKLEKYYLEGG